MTVLEAQFLTSAARAADLPHDAAPQIALVGRSNVGKSSLMNRLLGRKGLAKTSSTPGRTRAVNYFLIDRRFWFVDLPGYGYAKAAKDDRREWAALVESYLRDALPRLRLVQLVDGFVGATPLDVQAYEYLSSLGAAPVVAVTKIDRVPRGKRARALSAIRGTLGLTDDIPLIPVSAQSGEGMKELWGAVVPHLESSTRARE